MGLDSVELVLNVEERFGVSIPDKDAERVRTVSDLSELVVSLLPKTSAPCPSAQMFYRLRGAMVEEAAASRREIRPGSRLEELLPESTRRRVWSRLRERVRGVPDLRMDGPTQAIRVIAILAIFAVVPFSFVLSTVTSFGVVAAVACSILLAAVLFLRLSLRLRRHFPPEIVTVGDLATRVSMYAIDERRPMARVVMADRVLLEVRRLVAEQMKLPIEEVKPESHLFRDLGMG